MRRRARAEERAAEHREHVGARLRAAPRGSPCSPAGSSATADRIRTLLRLSASISSATIRPWNREPRSRFVASRATRRAAACRGGARRRRPRRPRTSAWSPSAAATAEAARRTRPGARGGEERRAFGAGSGVTAGSLVRTGRGDRAHARRDGGRRRNTAPPGRAPRGRVRAGSTRAAGKPSPERRDLRHAARVCARGAPERSGQPASRSSSTKSEPSSGFDRSGAQKRLAR